MRIQNKRDTHQQFSDNYLRNLRLLLAKDNDLAGSYDAYLALALLCREQLIDRWLTTQKRYRTEKVKRVCYLSMEFLMGRYLQNAVLNMDLEDDVRRVMQQNGMILEDIYQQEFDPGLGNGGLGRLASCFLDSMATKDIPTIGYGLRYEFGIFRQQIRDGFQVEQPDNWLHLGNPWEIARPDEMVAVHFNGRTESYYDVQGKQRRRWCDTDVVMALPYDTPVPGYGTETINTLRLWEARSSIDLDFGSFNAGDYMGAVARRVDHETITKVLYPADHIREGRELRLKQQYLFVAASLRDIIVRFLEENDDFRFFPDKVAVQLNDTHPTLAIPELMRILVDEYEMGWSAAWDITRRSMAYTNHTLLPEALECWSVELFGQLLPRHLEIIYEVNHRFLETIRTSHSADFLADVSIIQESPRKMVRMGHLAIVGSHSTNGVAKLHTSLLKAEVVPAFHQLFPDRFNNKTNGVTPRRWLKQANPLLSLLISKHIGSGWVRDLHQLEKLRPLVAKSEFRENWQECKAANKIILADYLARQQDIHIDPESLFDVQVKRIHEYKRQLLNLLHIIGYYFLLKENMISLPVSRTVMIGGKAAPGYGMAKLIIKLATAVGEVVNHDPQTCDLLKVIFLENYRVSLAERVFPAADLSEQISTAGLEASGTGNMKFALNGALTIGTMDGANVEITEAVGSENIFIFGLHADEVMSLKNNGYDQKKYVEANPLLREVLHSLQGNLFL